MKKCINPVRAIIAELKSVANVISYIRRNGDWGDAHNLPLVTIEQVKAVRETIADRSAAWTADELVQQFPDSQ